MNIRKRFEAAFKFGGAPSDAEVARRVTALLEQQGAGSAGVPTQTIQKIRQKGLKNSRYIPHIAHCLGVSSIWLAEGVGEMTPEKNFTYSKHRETFAAFSRLPADLQEHFAALIECYRRPKLTLVSDED